MRLLIATVLLSLFVPGCTSAPSDQDSIVDITWRDGAPYTLVSRRGDASRYPYAGKFDRTWYESQLARTTSEGEPVAPVDQFEFKEVDSNIDAGSITIAGTREETSVAPPSENELAEEAEFFDKTGQKVMLSRFRGKPLILVFTRGYPGYVCPMCVAYTGQFAMKADAIERVGARVVVVYPVRTTDKDTVNQFVDACEKSVAQDGEESLPYPVLIDIDAKAVDQFGIAATNPEFCRPSTFILDSEGVAVWGHAGGGPNDRPSVDCVLGHLVEMNGQKDG